MSMYAQDLDAGENGTVTFSLREGEPTVHTFVSYLSVFTYSVHTHIFREISHVSIHISDITTDGRKK